MDVIRVEYMAFVAMFGARRLPFTAFSFDMWAKQEKDRADLQAVARALCNGLIAVDRNTVVWKKLAGDSCLPKPNQYEFGLQLCDESDSSSDAQDDIHLLAREYRDFEAKLNYVAGTLS
uniref:Uncharacterized protein n=1 Tax=Salix viminalis TaxID=40686 RepID=A0A6N2L996_SALVM